MDLQLQGKTVLVPGGAKGIGLACARVFAAEGCGVHIAARTPERLERARALIGAAAQIHPADLRRHSRPPILRPRPATPPPA